MSRPANPLNKFRSYSYYHVLTICDCSQTADELSRVTNPSKWLHPSAPNTDLGNDDTFGLLGPFAVKYVNEQARTGRYCVLINGATDAAFSLVRAKWTSATAADVTMFDRSTSIAIEGELEISEPKGVVFLDIIVACSLALGIDAANAVFVLKTFFVGHSDTANVSNQEEYLTDVEPLRFIAYDVSGTFAETGGLYRMSFVALAHGASRLPQFGKAASGLNITGGTLLQTFENLAGVIKQNYNDLFECVKKTVTDKNINPLLTRVDYEFELDEAYTAPEYIVSDAPQHTKDKSGCTKEAKIPIPANMSIEDAIHLIMRKTPRVTEEAAKGVQTGDKTVHYEYKIHSGVRSSRVENRIFYTVVYRIQRFMRPKDVSLFDLAANVGDRDLSQLPIAEVRTLSREQQQLRKNLIVFDYIYTGKNVDILELEMKMNLGLAYLQIATINNTLKDQLQAVPTAVAHVPLYEQSKMATRFGRPTQVPVFFGTQIRSPSTRNKQQLSDNAEAAYTMNKHASIEVQDVTMRIYGNPKLLGTANRISAPESLGKAPPEQSDDDNIRVADFPDFGNFPAFAKINIKMPRNNDDISLFRGEAIQNPQTVGSADFTRDFWFTGYYYVVGMQHIFEGGEFTQELSLIGIPQSKAFKAVNQAGQSPQDLALQKGVLSCYDSRVDPCAASTNVAVTPHDAQNQTQVEAMDRTTVNAVTKDGRDTNTVSGWNTAPGDVRAAITSAANKYGVDEGYLASVAQKESNFNPNAKAKTSTASGLFQFTDKTWDRLTTRYRKQLGLLNATPEEIRAKRFDPVVNSEAAALLTREHKNRLERDNAADGYIATPSDLYLAHFMGVGDASKIIRASNINANASVSDTLGAARHSEVIAANPTYTNKQTVNAWRNHNAAGLGVTIPVVQSTDQSASQPTASSSHTLTTARVTPNVKTRAVKAATKVERSKQCPPKEDKKQETKQDPCVQTAPSSKS